MVIDMNDKKNENKGFWNSLPGTITKISGLILAIGSLITILTQVGIISTNKSELGNTGIENKISKICEGDPVCFVICESAYEAEEEANKRVIELGWEGYTGRADYFWIPDLGNLSKAELYQVYIGPFHNESTAKSELCLYNQKYNKITYGVKIYDGKRYEFRCSN